MKDKKVIINEFREALLAVNRIEALRIMKDLYKIDNNDFAFAAEIIRIVLEDIGIGWEEGTISLSQVYMSGIICEMCVDSILTAENKIERPSLSIGIGVLLDQHSLGKKIVTSIIRLNGYEVIDFGEGLSIDEMVKKTLDNHIEVLLISTLMLPSALKVRDVVKKLHEKDEKIKVLAGGAPFRLDKNLWAEVGLDADIRSNADIVRILEEVTGE